MMQSLDKRRIWKYVGVFGIFSNIGIAAYYTFMESWTLGYLIHSIKGTFTGLNQEGVVQVFDNYVARDLQLSLHKIFRKPFHQQQILLE